MRRYQLTTVLKTLISEITSEGSSVFKQVKRGRIIEPSEYPICEILIPLTERFVEPNSGTTFPHTINNDVILMISTNIGEGEKDDEVVDELIDAVKDKLVDLRNTSDIIGYQWQHDEEFEDTEKNIQGVAIYLTIQYKDKRY